MNSISTLFDSTLGNSLLIPEIACAHLGNITLAYAYIDFIKSCGLKCVKFQAHDPLFESSKSESFRVIDKRIPYLDRFSYWSGTSFELCEWQSISTYAKSKDLLFGLTPNSRQIAESLFKTIQVDFWKVGSSDIDNFHLLEFLNSTNVPVIISTGLSTPDDIVSSREIFTHESVAYLSCISKYPAPLEDFHVSRLDELQSLCRPTDLVGLSDHSATIVPSLLSHVHGFRIFEFHVNLSPFIFNFDSSSSLLPDQIHQLVYLFKQFSYLPDQPDSSLNITNHDVKSLFSKRIYTTCFIPKGTQIIPAHLAMIRTSVTVGLPQASYNSVRGLYSICDIPEGTPVQQSLLTSKL